MAPLVADGGYQDRSIAVLIPARQRYTGPAWDVISALWSLGWPMNCDKSLHVVGNREVGVAYDMLFGQAIEGGKSYALTFEEDMLPTRDIPLRLLEALETHPEFVAVSALYCTKSEPALPLIVGHPDKPGDTTYRRAPAVPGLIEVNAIPMGCALWRLAPFRAGAFNLPPWFKTTDKETQDVHFCLKARAEGFRFAVDTRLRAGHLDVRTGTVY